MSKYSKGIQGEEEALEYLENLGYICVATRYRGGDGEIDLIMLDQDIVVFVEVKARKNSPQGSGIMSITTDKQLRCAHAAMDFLTKAGWLDRLVRFDVVEISSVGILHIPNAFQPGFME